MAFWSSIEFLMQLIITSMLCTDYFQLFQALPAAGMTA